MLFFTFQPAGWEDILEGISKSVNDQMNLYLTKPVSEKEIKKALFSMHPSKVLGPDGMSPTFFQKFWHIIARNGVGATIFLCLWLHS